MRAAGPSLRADIAQHADAEICYDPVLEPPNSLCITPCVMRLSSQKDHSRLSYTCDSINMPDGRKCL